MGNATRRYVRVKPTRLQLEPIQHQEIRKALAEAGAKDNHVGAILEAVRSLEVDPDRLYQFYKELGDRRHQISDVVAYIMGRINEKREFRRSIPSGPRKNADTMRAIRMARYAKGVKLGRVLDAVRAGCTTTDQIVKHAERAKRQAKAEAASETVSYDQRLVELGIEPSHLQWIGRAIEDLDTVPDPSEIAALYHEHPSSNATFRQSVLRESLQESPVLRSQIEYVSAGNAHVKFRIRTAIHYHGIPASRVLFAVAHGPATNTAAVIQKFHDGVNIHLSGGELTEHVRKKVEQYLAAHPHDNQPVHTQTR